MKKELAMLMAGVCACACAADGNANTTSNDFTVLVNGKAVAVYNVMQTFAKGRIEYDGGHYEIASFDADEPVSVEIHSKRDLSKTTILPENTNVSAEISSDTIRFKLAKHGTYIFEPQTYRDTPLFLFFNAPEKNIPDPKDPKVKWFGPGLHSPGKIELKDDETLYLAPGAIVEAWLYARGRNIRVCGRGVLTQRAMNRKDVVHSVVFYHCDNLTLEGFVAADPCHWNVVLRDCHNVSIDNVKICGGRMINDDGIDICNSTDVTIRNCFIRAQDDVITPKGMLDEEGFTSKNPLHSTHFEPDRRGISNVLAEKCVFWNDAANVFRIGYEGIGEAMENITVRDCDIVHFNDVFRPAETYWTNTVWYIQPSHKMPIRHLLFENLRIYADVPDVVLARITPMECPPFIDFGTAYDITFRNITITGPCADKLNAPVLIAGHDEASTVSGVTFENFIIGGKKLTSKDPSITIGDFVKDVTFK